MSTARQRVWLETRWVPLTKREWPECRQEIRSVQWAARTVSSDWMRRSSRGLPRSWAGLQPWRVVGCRWGLWASAWVEGAGGGVGGVGVAGGQGKDLVVVPAGVVVAKDGGVLGGAAAH